MDPDSRIYLFGSRTDDNQKGGDIDILIITNQLTYEDLCLDIDKQVILSGGWVVEDINPYLESKVCGCVIISKGIVVMEGVVISGKEL